jgi:hypothetical protein
VSLSRVDTEALIARLQARDDAALTEAYGRVFDSELGAFVLADILTKAQIGARRTDDLPGRVRAFHDGRIDLALEIAGQARVGAEAVAIRVMTENDDDLRGRNHERDADSFGRPDADPDLGD